MPRTWSLSKSQTANGKCFIEVTYAEPGGSDRELAEKIKLAAFTLVTFCVQGKHSGGIARGLGENVPIVNV